MVEINLEELLNEYLKDNRLMQLATVADGYPWLCNLYFVHDDDNNIYWTSAKIRRHSKELKADSRVAATILRDEDKKQALQITGDAFEVPLKDVEYVDKLYASKFGDKSRAAEVLANDPDGRAFWVLKPKLIEFWDEVNFPDAHKQTIVNIGN
ncbi:MAG: pyridoxamine 5'-phosphate oxidase family protein [Candidatus Pacebacteria bacterium]|nr:pyridoxamine 5'-phosphate oxidase family protein [Candidatus Paceibacterota bacterium]